MHYQCTACDIKGTSYDDFEDCRYNRHEILEFLDQLSSKQFAELQKFFETMPKLSHKIQVTNPNTGVESEVVLEGLASFFA